MDGTIAIELGSLSRRHDTTDGPRPRMLTRRFDHSSCDAVNSLFKYQSIPGYGTIAFALVDSGSHMVRMFPCYHIDTLAMFVITVRAAEQVNCRCWITTSSSVESIPALMLMCIKASRQVDVDTSIYRKPPFKRTICLRHSTTLLLSSTVAATDLRYRHTNPSHCRISRPFALECDRICSAETHSQGWTKAVRIVW